MIVDDSEFCRLEIAPNIEPVVSIRKNTSSDGMRVEKSSGRIALPAGSWYGSTKKKSCVGPLRRYATTVICASPTVVPIVAVMRDTSAVALAKPGMLSVGPVIVPTAELTTAQVTWFDRSSGTPSRYVPVATNVCDVGAFRSTSSNGLVGVTVIATSVCGCGPPSVPPPPSPPPPPPSGLELVGPHAAIATHTNAIHAPIDAGFLMRRS